MSLCFYIYCKNHRLAVSILYYIYGIFYSNIYRETYAEFLKIDFPRVPFTSNDNLFREISSLADTLNKYVSGLSHQTVSMVDIWTLIIAILAAIISGASTYVTFKGNKACLNSLSRKGYNFILPTR